MELFFFVKISFGMEIWLDIIYHIRLYSFDCHELIFLNNIQKQSLNVLNYSEHSSINSPSLGFDPENFYCKIEIFELASIPSILKCQLILKHYFGCRQNYSVKYRICEKSRIQPNKLVGFYMTQIMRILLP